MFSVRRTISSASRERFGNALDASERERELHDVGERVDEPAAVADIAPHVGGDARGRDRFIEAA